ncbi:MAG: hypothetical protein GY782_02310 [Gammaproteobacteria bacterium]|nr:hypothetical protein [Gammaproteobacteria bacterium]
MKTENFTDCALASIAKVHKMTEMQLNKTMCLPCGCDEITMADLLGYYSCDCDVEYYYSFCQKQVLDKDSFWHCNDCRKCREMAEWHCSKCNECTFGNTLPCENCGTQSPYAPPYELSE